jgi:hypothetical protein
MIYAAKCYWPGVTEQELRRAVARAVAETTASRADVAVTYLGSILFQHDELVLCLFDAASRAVVRRTAERAGIPCERVMDSRWLPANAPQPPNQSLKEASAS